MKTGNISINTLISKKVAKSIAFYVVLITTFLACSTSVLAAACPQNILDAEQSHMTTWKIVNSTCLPADDTHGCKDFCGFHSYGISPTADACGANTQCCYCQDPDDACSYVISTCEIEAKCKYKDELSSVECTETLDACNAKGGIGANLGKSDCASPKACCVVLKKSASAGTSSGAVAIPTIKLENPLGNGVGIFGIMGRVVKTFLGFVGALALLIFIYAGVTYMTAGGDAGRVTKARDTMKYAVIGLALIIFAYAIVVFFLTSVTGQAF
ncbi:MAG: pilin [Patescibacteria group bacterium]